MAAPASAKRVSIRPAHLTGGSVYPAPPVVSPVAAAAANSLSAELAEIRAAAASDQASASAASDESQSDSVPDDFHTSNRIKMSNARWFKRAGNASRRARGPSVAHSFNAQSAVEQMVRGGAISSGVVETFCSVAERVADSDQITSAVRSMASGRPMADPIEYHGDVLKPFSFDADGVFVFSSGPRELFEDYDGSSSFVSKAAWVAKSLEDAAACDPLARPDVLLSSSGVPLVDLECSASMDVSVNVTPSPNLNVPTKLRSVLRPNESGFSRGFFCCAGWLHIKDVVSCRVYIGDCREHPDGADDSYWKDFRDKVRTAIWRSLHDMATITFQSNGGSSIRQRTNTMRLDNNVDDYLAQHPNAIVKIEKPALFFRLLVLHGLKLNVCLSIAVVSHGHKYLPSQCSPEFSVVESPGSLEVSDEQMKPAMDAIAPFIDDFWIQAGWKHFVEAFVDAVQCPVRVGTSFGMYISGSKHGHDSSDGSSARLYAVPSADFLTGGRNGTTAWPFGLPFRWPTSITRESPPGSTELSFSYRQSEGHVRNERIPLSPPTVFPHIPTRCSQVMVYHPSRQLFTDRINKTLLDRLKKKDVDMRRQVEDIQTLNGWLQAMLRQDPGPLVELHSAKRFEGHFVTEITPDHEVGDLEAALERTLTWWIHCSAQWSTLKFYSGAEELVLHLRTKIRVLIQICIGGSRCFCAR
jgi:hypothetical protein